MSDEWEAEMKAKMDKVMSLVQSVADAASGDNPLEDLQKSLDQIEATRRELGLPDDEGPSSTDHLRQSIGGFQTHFQNVDAALWIGDMKRAETLTAEFDPSAGMVGFEFSDDEDDEDDESGEEDEGGIDLASLLAELGEDDDEDDDAEDDNDEDDFDPELSMNAFLASIEAQKGDPEAVDLYAAIEAGEPGAIDAFIATGTDPNTPSGEWQRTALHAALDAPGRSAEGLKKLVAAGADPNPTHFAGDSLLSWAMGYHHHETVSAEGERDLVAWLISVGHDPNYVAPHFGSVIARGIVQGSAPLVEALLSAGVDPNGNIPADFQPEFLAGVSFLTLAAPKPDTVRVLLARGADPATATGFVADQAKAAAARIDPDDPWTEAFANALHASLALMVTGAERP